MSRHQPTHRRLACAAALTLVVGLLGVAGCSSDDDGGAGSADTNTQGDAGNAADAANAADAVVGDAGDASDDDASSTPSLFDHALDARGPFEVGFRSFEHTYDVATYAPKLSGERTVTVAIWYPAPAGATDAAAAPAHPLHANGLFEDPHAVIDLPAADPAGPPLPSEADEGGAARYPVLIHSHGYQGFAGNSAGLMSWFASHGWVAVAPDHEGNTLADNALGESPLNDIYRPLDLRAALDAVAADATLGSDLNLEHIALSGHSRGTRAAFSMGGATHDAAVLAETCGEDGAFERACTEAELQTYVDGFADPRVQAVLTWDGGLSRDMFGPTGHSSIEAPVQVQLRDGRHTLGQEIFDTTSDIALTWIEVEGACHQTWGNQSFGVGVCETLDSDEGTRIIATYALAFARHHVLGDDGAATTAILSGATEVSPLVTMQSHP